MARMLGTNRAAGCGRGRCYHCEDGDETRRFKRREQRAVAADAVAQVADLEPDRWWLTGPLFTDVGVDCEHGCNGSPCGAPCSFVCHQEAS